MLIPIIILWQYTQMVLAFYTPCTTVSFGSRSFVGRELRQPLLHQQVGAFRQDYDMVDEEDKTGVLALIENTGESLKPAAERANAKATFVDGKWEKFRYLLQSCVLYTLFIVYRGYRGFFVILPSVFRNTYKKMQNVVEVDPFGVAYENDRSSISGQTASSQPWRTTITLTILSSIVTLSYVLGGLLRVIGTAIRAGGGWTNAFEKAAMAQQRHEEALCQREPKHFWVNERTTH